MEHKIIESDVLIIGGGTAGCYAAIRLGENTGYSVAIADKADIRRSGCLAAGVNALNAYITEGHVPMDYVRYAAKDAGGIVREDLLLDIAERLNDVTQDMERRGLTILKDEEGKYVTRGWRNLKINGENIKPILAAEVKKQKNVKLYEHVNITDLITGEHISGAMGFGINDGCFYEFRAKAVLIASGGAAGIYRPNNGGELSHQMWYPPFNTGAGYAMGILAGAEMTTFEMRFIALRCKDTIAPTGTLAQGVGARQVNAKGDIYENRYGLSTPDRVWGTVEENRAGRGPCYLKTEGIDEEAEENLYKAYLNMAPLQTLKWLDSGFGPSKRNVEIEGTEPYIVGGHTASGYWVKRDRGTTIDGLFAAGDVAGGAPQKYVTGALAEGEIAAEGIIEYLKTFKEENAADPDQVIAKKAEYEGFLGGFSEYTPRQLEHALQKIMDEYAGGIRTGYGYTEAGLSTALERLKGIEELLRELRVEDTYGLLQLYEVRDRLVVARALIHHLQARKETRWHSFQENLDHPGKDRKYECYINSVFKNGDFEMFFRTLVKVPSEIRD